MAALVLALGLAVVFDVTNGFHDSANAIAALVATQAATPTQALVLASVCHIAGPLVIGTAVASTIDSIISVSPADVVAVVGAGLTAAVAWNLLTWWRGLPSSSSHALVGGLCGACIALDGWHAVRWGGFEGVRPTGVTGVLATLAVSPLVGFAAGWIGARVARRLVRRARRSVTGPVRRSEWATASALAFSHGANDAQKTMGVITAMLVAEGHLGSFAVPVWVKLVAACALSIGTGLGGWRIVKTVGSGIYRIRPLDGLVSQGASATSILGAALVGGPVSTTHVVASSVVGVGTAQRHRHVRWAVVREMGLAWVITLPAAAVLAATVLPVWRTVS